MSEYLLLYDKYMGNPKFFTTFCYCRYSCVSRNINTAAYFYNLGEYGFFNAD